MTIINYKLSDHSRLLKFLETMKQLKGDTTIIITEDLEYLEKKEILSRLEKSPYTLNSADIMATGERALAEVGGSRTPNLSNRDEIFDDIAETDERTENETQSSGLQSNGVEYSRRSGYARWNNSTAGEPLGNTFTGNSITMTGEGVTGSSITWVDDSNMVYTAQGNVGLGITDPIETLSVPSINTTQNTDNLSGGENFTVTLDSRRRAEQESAWRGIEYFGEFDTVR